MIVPRIVASTVGIVCWLIIASAQSVALAQDAARFKVGVLLTVPREEEFYQAFHQQMHMLGYIDGRALIIEYRNAQGQIEKLPSLAAELVRLKVDVILTASTPPAKALRQLTSTIPIVVAVSSDPVGNGLVTSLARPGGNITGLALMLPELSVKRLELLREAVPHASRVAVLSDSSNPAFDDPVKRIKQIAPLLGMRLRVLPVRTVDELEKAFATIERSPVDALFLWGYPVTYEHRARIVAFAARKRLPAIYDLREYAEDGGLMAYGPNVPDLFRRAATYVHKILKGAKPADLPVEQPTKFELVINMKTAKALGLTIPQSVLVRADEVIK